MGTGTLTLAIASGTLTLSPVNTSSKVDNLTVASSGGSYSGKLDLAGSEFIVQTSGGTDKSSKIGSLNTAIVAARGSPTWNWTGNGITSSVAAGDPNH